MNQREIQILQEMGLTFWQVRRPELFPNLEAPVINLPASCKLLFVSPYTLDEQDAWLFGRILSSMKLTPDQALSLPPEAVDQIAEHHLIWCWFAGCSGAHPTDCRVLHSAPLKEMHTRPETKKELWQQICSYDL